MGVFEVSTKDEWDSRHQAARDLGKAVVIDFGAEWCGPCRMMAPIYQAASSKFIKSMVFLKADASSEVAQLFQVSALPTFQVWRGGQKIAETVGANPKLEDWLQQFSSPIPQTSGFQGHGRTLAGGGVGTHTAAPQEATEGTVSGHDASLPSTTLQIRLMDGSRLTGHFNTTNTVGDVYKFVKEMRPKASAKFKLVTSHPTTPLTELEQSLQQVQLLNSVVIQKA